MAGMVDKVESYKGKIAGLEKEALSQEGEELRAEVAILQMKLCRWGHPDTEGGRDIRDSSIKKGGTAMARERVITASTTVPYGIPVCLQVFPYAPARMPNTNL